MYMVVRSWANAAELADVMQRKQQEVADIISGVPGFVAYYVARSGDTVTSVTVCEDKKGTQESTRLAGEWVKKNLSGSSVGTPQIAEGETFMQF